MEQYAYTPGTCNFDERTQGRWNTLGMAGFATAAALWFLFVFIGFPFYGQVEIVALLWLGFIGIWQSSLPFCEFSDLRLSGIPNTGRRPFRHSMLIAVLATGVLGVALLFSPIPAAEMHKFYMRLLQAA